MDLWQKLKAKYPDSEFEMHTPGGVIFLIINDMAIHDPMVSECGRFESKDYYGLSLEDAKALSEHNSHYRPGE